MDGTWTQLKDRFLLGVGDTYKTVNSTGGESTHLLTEDEMPSHRHTNNSIYATTPGTGTSTGVAVSGGTGIVNWYADNTGLQGKNYAHNNMPPYRTVYMWKRTK